MKSLRIWACLLVFAVLGPGPSSVDAGPETMGIGPTSETVMLLHGLGRSDRAMRAMEQRLVVAGFEVENLRYPSTRLGPEEIVELVDREIDSCCRGSARLHFITHSLGGIVVRAYLATNRPKNLGRVVMLSPPNQGSELVDRFDGRIFRWMVGETGSDLGTDPNSLPNRLPPVDFPLGVIAGTASLNPIGSVLIPGDDDGTVAVARMRVAGMADFLPVRHSHTFIMRAPSVAAQAIRFLRFGHFDHAKPQGEGR